MTRYLYIYLNAYTLAHTYVFYTRILLSIQTYYIIINTRPRICAHYNSSHILYNTHEGSLLTTAASAGFPLQERSSMDIYLYYYHFFFLPHSCTNSPFPGKAFIIHERPYNILSSIYRYYLPRPLSCLLYIYIPICSYYSNISVVHVIRATGFR